jgi:TetR/AcrR family transcriptional repressor of mexJK operon
VPSETQSPVPLSQRKERDILRAATEVFLSQGYLGASMDEIATGAGVSKATIYKHFGSKKALFQAIIRNRVDGLVSPLRIDAAETRTACDVLTAFARQYVDLILQPSSLALYRVVVFEAFNNEELGRDTYRVGGAATIGQVASFLSERVEAGELALDDPSMAAEQFIGLLTGHLQLRALLGVETDPPAAMRARFVEAAVSTFLRCYSSSSGARLRDAER